MPRLTGLLLLGCVTLSATAHAESHAVTVRNGAADTIRVIQVGPGGRLGENRMRSQLPPGAEARITYSTGCQADVRLTYASGQTEDHAGLDVCSDPHIVAGQAGTSSAASVTPAPSGAATAPTPISAATPAATAPSGTRPAPTPQVAKIPVPPWTGRSITRRFGGMD